MPQTPHVQARRLPEWERITAFGKNVPQGDLLQGVQELFNLTWDFTSGNNNSNSDTYTLFKTPQARVLEDRLYRKSLEQALKPLMAVAVYTRTPQREWARQHEELRKQNKGPDDPLLRGPVNGGNLRSLASPSGHAALKLLLTLNSAQRGQLVGEDKLFVPWSEMNAPQRTFAETAVSDSFDTRDFQTGKDLPEEREQNLAWLHSHGLRLTVQRSTSTGAVTSYSLGTGPWQSTMASFKDDAKQYLLPVRGCPYENTGNAKDASETDASETDYSVVAKQPFPKTFKFYQLNGTKVPMWREVLEALSKEFDKESDLVFLSDDYMAMRDMVFFVGKPWPDFSGMNLAQGFDALCEFFGKVWWRKGNQCYFRSRTWFIDRLYEPPPKIIAAIEKRLQAAGGYHPQALDLLSQLTPHQLEGWYTYVGFRVTQAGGLNYYGQAFEARRNFPLIQFFRCLNPEQKRLALTKGGIAWEDMNSVQQDAYATLGATVRGRRMAKYSAPPSFEMEVMEGMKPSNGKGPARLITVMIVGYGWRGFIRFYVEPSSELENLK